MTLLCVFSFCGCRIRLYLFCSWHKPSAYRNGCQNRPENHFPGRRMDHICWNYAEFLMGQSIKSEFHAYPPDNNKCRRFKARPRFNKETNIDAAKRIMIKPITPPAKMTRNWPPSKPPMAGSGVPGSVTASATAAKMESTAKAMSASSTFNTVCQNRFLSVSSALCYVWIHTASANGWLRCKTNIGRRRPEPAKHSPRKK